MKINKKYWLITARSPLLIKKIVEQKTRTKSSKYYNSIEPLNTNIAGPTRKMFSNISEESAVF